ncbi:MAG: ATP-binding cassette domain-containing protein [Desulfobacterales bacterium]|nr:ATP-binding cassette domain-containing protein [Desulfobacterales bacterium]
MINIQSLTFSYPSGEFQLDIEKLSVASGEKVAFIGPSGSGKTTLLNLVAGILPLQNGSIKVANDEISALSDTARRNFRITNIGFIFQDFGLLDYLDVRDNILHPYRITSALKLDSGVQGRADMLAEQMGIADKLLRHPSDLSHGERQRVAICRALLTGPKLILADEATGNLDPKNKLHILELLFESVKSHGATLLAVTHDQELLPNFDRVVNFNDFLQGEAI